MKRTYDGTTQLGIKVNGRLVVEFESEKFKFIGLVKGALGVDDFEIDKVYENYSPVDFDGEGLYSALFKGESGYNFWMDMRCFEKVQNEETKE